MLIESVSHVPAWRQRDTENIGIGLHRVSRKALSQIAPLLLAGRMGGNSWALKRGRHAAFT